MADRKIIEETLDINGDVETTRHVKGGLTIRTILEDTETVTSVRVITNNKRDLVFRLEDSE